MMLHFLFLFSQSVSEYLVVESDFKNHGFLPLSPVFESWEIGHERPLSDIIVNGEILLVLEVISLNRKSYIGLVIFQKEADLMITNGKKSLKIKDDEVIHQIFSEFDRLDAFSCATGHALHPSVLFLSANTNTIIKKVCNIPFSPLEKHNFFNLNNPIAELISEHKTLALDEIP